jgi:hypothetical protein
VREGEYLHTDATVEPGRAHRYRLEVVRGAGSDWEGPVEIATPGGVTVLAYERAAPNPLADGTTLTLAIPREGDAVARAYDFAGHEVAETHRGPLSPGRAALGWAGMDKRGRRLAPGVCLVRADVNGETAPTRVIRLP